MQMSDKRYAIPLPDLIARFTLRKGLFRKERVEAHLFDLNQFGCVLKTDKVFEPGDTLGLELEMEMPFENLRASGLTGLITERRKYCSNFFYSIDFIGSDFRPKADSSEQLKRIRDVVDRKLNLLSRRENTGLSATA
ncbi:hypothetical protein SAMN05216203_0418 [Marinobacter daqiaonensis]|uniref:PilZ domain-containing protein n=1 Tax=Marinobacter daqiaonensis TaxID=650891 RepID=A0A1I6GRZ9_9GAMM|nr:hypothetical protein [Marinobacter daqiaonensis]SFR44972.1 hypothetical protein SAMN05216203_0418 [Marinobacter daqiaonensis]